MRFKCLDSKALILKSRKELVTSLVAAAVVTAAPSGCDRHGPGGIALWTRGAAEAHRPGDHRRSDPADFPDAPCCGGTAAAVRLVAH